jgi:hypothetical protein
LQLVDWLSAFDAQASTLAAGGLGRCQDRRSDAATDTLIADLRAARRPVILFPSILEGAPAEA